MRLFAPCLSILAGSGISLADVPTPRLYTTSEPLGTAATHPAFVRTIKTWPDHSNSVSFNAEASARADWVYDAVKSRGLTDGTVAIYLQKFGEWQPLSGHDYTSLGQVTFNPNDGMSSSLVEYWRTPWFKTGAPLGSTAFQVFRDRYEYRRNNDSSPAPRPSRIILDNEHSLFPTTTDTALGALWAAMLDDPGARGNDSNWPVVIDPNASSSANKTLAALYADGGSPSLDRSHSWLWSQSFSNWYNSLLEQARSAMLQQSIGANIGPGTVWSNTLWSNWNNSTTDGQTVSTVPPFTRKRTIKNPFIGGAATWLELTQRNWAPLNAPSLYTTDASLQQSGETRAQTTLRVCRADVESILFSSVGGSSPSPTSITPWIVPVGRVDSSYTTTKSDVRELLAMLSRLGISEFLVFSGDGEISSSNWSLTADAVSQGVSSYVTGAQISTGSGTVTADQLRRANWDFASATTSSTGSGTIEATLDTTHAGHNNLRIVVEMKPPTGSGASAEVQAYNYETTTWDVVGTISNGQWTSPRTIVTSYDQFRRASDRHVDSSNGQMKIRVAVTGATGSSTISVDAVQVYRVDELCVKDYNRDGFTTLDDLAEFTSDFYSTVPVGKTSDDDNGFGIRMPGTATPFGLKTDFTQDGALTLDDLAEFINEYYSSPGTGC